nr:MAG TPA: ribosome, tRNA, helicase, RIBOSOME [Crassvirales sp.]
MAFPRRCRGLTADATARAVKMPPMLCKDSHYALTRSRCHPFYYIR